MAILGDKVNLAFPPSPPQLRALALDEWAKARGALWRYRRLADGKPEPIRSNLQREVPEKIKAMIEEAARRRNMAEMET